LLGVHSRYGLHTRAVTVFRDTLSEGFSYFVTSIAAPVASGWSGCRVGLAPTGKRRLFTAHTHTVIDDLVPGRARQRHDDGQCARTEYPCSDIGLEPTPPEVIAALRAEIAAFDASVTETGNG
jgi:hypothetical protein